MDWVVYIVSFTAMMAGAQLVRHDEPIWGGVLLGLGIALAHLSGEMYERKKSNQRERVRGYNNE